MTLKTKILNSVFTIILCFQSNLSFSQMESRNGKTLPANGTLRVLLIFVEMDYDVHDSLDPARDIQQWTAWKKGKLPDWKDDFFSPDTFNLNQGKLSRFYAESSFNNFKVLGDYYRELITIKESEVKNAVDGNFHLQKIREILNQNAVLITRRHLIAKDFDLWTFTRPGEKKITPSTDDPLRFDHVMFIYRNLRNLPDANGRAYPNSCGKLFGFDSDSYSQFGANNLMPFNITRHEFTHLFLGDNNFHSGGGERMGNNCYLMSIQCMWSIIGAANASLLTCNAWDRDRFDWKPAGKQFTISTVDENQNEVPTDISEPFTDTKTFIIRDFVTTGDAIRIKLPNVPEDEFGQYLWIENHQTKNYNKSEFDQFQYHEYECREKAQPGLYMYVQIDRDNKTGSNIYNGHADYLHPLSAEGAYDYKWDTVKVKNTCVNDVMYPVLTDKKNNALTGTQTLEVPPLNYDGNDALTYNETGMPYVELIDGNYVNRLRPHGISAVAFNKSTSVFLNNFTNPATTNVLTANSFAPPRNANTKNITGTINYNSKTIYLNGLSVKIIEQLEGAVKVEIGFNDFEIKNNIRWCADSILAPAGKTISIINKSRLILDQGLTPTRNNKPIEFKGEKIFASKTVFTLSENCTLIINEGCKLIADNESKIYMMPDSKIIVEEGGTLELKNNSQLKMIQSKIQLKKGAKLTVNGKQNLIKDEKSNLISVSPKQISFK